MLAEVDYIEISKDSNLGSW